jgi:hypothetical protein
MSSLFAQQIRKTNEIHFLLILDFDGLKKYYADSPIALGDFLFEDKLLSISDIKSSFDIRSFRYSYPSISVTIKNPYDSTDRLQDIDALKIIDGGIGNIYIWTPGISWAQLMNEGPKFSGIFQENIYDDETFTFNLVDKSESKFLNIPNSFINSDTFPQHKKDYAGYAQSVVFGDWNKGVPLYCSSEFYYQFFVSSGIMYSGSTAFYSGEEHIYTNSGVTYTTFGYYLHDFADKEGNIYSYITMSGDQSASEPLNCSIKGIKNLDNTLIEHPADIINYVFKNYSMFKSSEVDDSSIKTFKSSMSFGRCASIVNDNIDSSTFIDRLLSQFLCCRIVVGDKIGIMVPDLDKKSIASFTKSQHNIGERIPITKTDFNLIVNDLTVFYKLNPSTGNYEGRLRKHRTNNSKCRSSFFDYKSQKFEKVLYFSDINNDAVANSLAERYLDFYSHRHHVVSMDMRYHEAFDLREGDVALLTIPEGGNINKGYGWVDERFLLIEKQYKKDCITTVWWKINVVSKNNSPAVSGGSGVASGTGTGWLGDGWLGEGWL